MIGPTYVEVIANDPFNWSAAVQYQRNLLGLNVQGWMSETTVENLKRQQDAFGRDATAKKQLDKSTERPSDRR